MLRIQTLLVRRSLMNFLDSVHRECVFCWSEAAQFKFPRLSPTGCPVSSSTFNLAISSERWAIPSQT